MGNSINFGKRSEVEKKSVYNMWDNSKIISYSSALTQPHKLLFLCYSGSKLHGTDSELSDIDIKGIFLPTDESAFCGDMPETLNYSSNDNDKNTNDDIDITLWSIQKWMKLLEKGDSNALSMLFSSLNNEMMLFVDPQMVDVLSKGYLLFNPKNINSYTGFSKSQVLKYSQKGKRLRLLGEIVKYISTHSDKTHKKLGDLDLNQLVWSLGDKDVFIDTDENKNIYLNILGKKYQNTIPLEEFVDRININIKVYGRRAKNAEDGVDWKSLAHSLRTLVEAVELLTRGYIVYPLESADIIKRVKYNKMEMDEFMEFYTHTETIIDKLKNESTVPNQFDRGKKLELLLNLYGKG